MFPIRWQWLNQPDTFTINDNEITITTQPHTDLWQKTYYHFINDNAPMLQTQTSEPYFSFTVQCDFTNSHTRFDQCGIVLYLNSENWLKASVEYENEHFQQLGSVVTNNGYSDWATIPIDPTIKRMWYRLSRRQNDYRIEYSYDGTQFQQMRICHLTQGDTTIQLGVYACSPENSSFTARFTQFEFSECQWHAHDGQQPDF
ncbi:MAG: DUF1349 domain-containing protein [Aerococcaceae bacterium]|nr:DUF1349 domain-containing protein [Aerococcaceae bacterium]